MADSRGPRCRNMGKWKHWGLFVCCNRELLCGEQWAHFEILQQANYMFYDGLAALGGGTIFGKLIPQVLSFAYCSTKCEHQWVWFCVQRLSMTNFLPMEDSHVLEVVRLTLAAENLLCCHWHLHLRPCHHLSRLLFLCSCDNARLCDVGIGAERRFDMANENDVMGVVPNLRTSSNTR